MKILMYERSDNLPLSKRRLVIEIRKGVLDLGLGGFEDSIVRVYDPRFNAMGSEVWLQQLLKFSPSWIPARDIDREELDKIQLPPKSEWSKQTQLPSVS